LIKLENLDDIWVILHKNDVFQGRNFLKKYQFLQYLNLVQKLVLVFLGSGGSVDDFDGSG